MFKIHLVGRIDNDLDMLNEERIVRNSDEGTVWGRNKSS